MDEPPDSLHFSLLFLQGTTGQTWVELKHNGAVVNAAVADSRAGDHDVQVTFVYHSYLLRKDYVVKNISVEFDHASLSSTLPFLTLLTKLMSSSS